MSITPEQRRIFLIGAAAAAAIVLTVSAVRLASRNNNDKPLSKYRLAHMSTEERRALTTTLGDAEAGLVASLHTKRAWCYANMQPPRHREVVRDCEAALALDPLDAMAVLRRSIALQELKAMAGK